MIPRRILMIHSIELISIFLLAQIEGRMHDFFSDSKCQQTTPQSPPLDSSGDDSLNVPGLISIVVFYMVVLVIGIWAGWRQRKISRASGHEHTDQEEVMLAGRNIGLFVGILTMGATWVGGGFINGSAEATYVSGLIWTQAPFGYALSLVLSKNFISKRFFF